MVLSMYSLCSAEIGMNSSLKNSTFEVFSRIPNKRIKVKLKDVRFHLFRP